MVSQEQICPVNNRTRFTSTSREANRKSQKLSPIRKMAEKTWQCTHIPEGYFNSSYTRAVIPWIMSCHKKHMTTCVITCWREYVTSLPMSILTMCFLFEIKFIFKAIKYHFKGSYDTQNLSLVIISYPVYETHQRLVSYEMTTRVRSSM